MTRSVSTAIKEIDNHWAMSSSYSNELNNEEMNHYNIVIEKPLLSMDEIAIPWFDVGKTILNDDRQFYNAFSPLKSKEQDDTTSSTEINSFTITAIDSEEMKENEPAEEDIEEAIRLECLEDTLLHNRRAANTIVLDDLQKHMILGEGFFGQVWMVTDSKVQSRPYALKVQSKHELATEDKLDMVMREKEAMIQIKSHPFILDLIKTFQDDHCLYMLTDLVQGGELLSLLRNQDGRQRSLPERQAKFYMLALADALAHIHGAKYIHRDIKPENILMDDKGYPIIIDFGCAKQLEENDMAFTMIGTPEYLAPEIIDTKGHNSSADRWSLGVVLYEMLFGVHPFKPVDEMTQMEVFESILEDDYNRPNLREANVSEHAFDLVSKLLVKDPKERLHNTDILRHRWFAGLSLGAMRKRKVNIPWVPTLQHPLDAGNFDDLSNLEDKSCKKYPALERREVILTEEF